MVKLFLALALLSRVTGDHWRIQTEHGPVHVFRPQGYDSRAAGTLVYVHGYYADVDAAWRDHRLAEQFAASNKQALFIVPEAPTGGGDDVRWTSLDELLATVHERTGLARPPGPVVVVGHSAAYRTIVTWLDSDRLKHVILVDALYGNEEDFLRWLDDADHRLTVVSVDTTDVAEPFVRQVRDAVTLPAIPEDWSRTPAAARKARVLYMRSQYKHMPLVTDGKALPVLIQRAPLRMRPTHVTWVDRALRAGSATTL